MTGCRLFRRRRRVSGACDVVDEGGSFPGSPFRCCQHYEHDVVSTTIEKQRKEHHA